MVMLLVSKINIDLLSDHSYNGKLKGHLFCDHTTLLTKNLHFYLLFFSCGHLCVMTLKKTLKRYKFKRFQFADDKQLFIFFSLGLLEFAIPFLVAVRV